MRFAKYCVDRKVTTYVIKGTGRKNYRRHVYWTGQGRRHAYMPKLIAEHNAFVVNLNGDR